MKGLLLVFLMSIAYFSHAQNNDDKDPVHWEYNIKKIGKSTFEVHVIANLEKGWHIYSQHQPKNAICQPTIIKYLENSGIEFTGSTKEIGDTIRFLDKTVDIGANQYEDKVEFVRIFLNDKNIVKKSIGEVSIKYQVCTEETCQRPKTKELEILVSDDVLK